MLRVAAVVCLMSAVSCVIAADRLSDFLAKDPSAEAEKAFTAGDPRHIVLPVCGGDRGEVIPGWPLEDSPEVQRAMDLGQRPLSCADFGEDPRKANFVRAAKHAERYNRRLLELEGKRAK